MAISHLQAEPIDLQDGEDVLSTVTPGWSAWTRWIILGALTCWFVLGIIIWYLVYRAWKKSGAVVTTDRVVQTHAGLLSDTTTEVWLNGVRGLTTTHQFLGGGAVEVDTGSVAVEIYARDAQTLAAEIRNQRSTLDE